MKETLQNRKRMGTVRKCAVCHEHKPTLGSTQKPDDFGNRIFVCKECSFPENNLSPLIEKTK